MAPPSPDTRQLVADAVLGPGFRRATFAGPARHQPLPWVRVTVRPVEVRGETLLQFAYFDGRKTAQKNHAPPQAGPPLNELLDAGFAGVHVSTRTEELDVRTTKKGKVFVGRRAADPVADADLAHNRVKDVPLPESRADHVLEVMGILTADGQVRPTMRAKFTQINEFLKHLRHAIDDAALSSPGRPVEILDCGCGASYLTVAAHHYLNDVLNIPARVLGVDVNEDVIRTSLERAGQLGGTGLSFACGRIGGLNATADIVLALHACDTATDDAIAQAVRAEAKVLLSVPCCHHALNRDIRAEGPASVLRPVLRHGILRERAADLVTDAFRTLALRIAGYRTDVVEFVSPEHTARNLMIRAVRGAPVADPALVEEYRRMREFWGVVPYIERALGEAFRRMVKDDDPGEASVEA